MNKQTNKVNQVPGQCQLRLVTRNATGKLIIYRFISRKTNR